MLLTEARWDQVVAPTLLVPVGSCEQHGPHLPLGTDSLIAEAVASGAAARLDVVLVAPTLAITASGEHQDFPGTLSIGTAALTDVLVELVRSTDWAAGVVFVNGHGGNAEAASAAAATLHAEGRDMLAIRPDLVAVDRAEAGVTAPIRELAPALQAHGVRAVSPNGVLGDPTGATAGQGADVLDALVAQVVDAVTAWRSTR